MYFTTRSHAQVAVINAAVDKQATYNKAELLVSYFLVNGTQQYLITTKQ